MAISNMHRFRNPALTGVVSSERLRAPVQALTHEVIPSLKIKHAALLAGEIIKECEGKFKQETGRDFDKYDKTDAGIMKPMILAHPSMGGVFSLLSLDWQHKDKLFLPWWNEAVGSDYKCERTANGMRILLQTRHSYQTQLLSKGVESESLADIRVVSVVGLVHTSDNKLVIGLRGGLNYPNTYYYSAGALRMSDEIKDGSLSIFEFYKKHELHAEYGMSAEDICDATLLSKVILHGGDRNTSYVFVVRTPLTFEGVIGRYNSNTDADKKEHHGLEPLESGRREVTAFVREFYSGKVENLRDRTFWQRRLLPQATAPLLDYVDADMSIMARFSAAGRVG